jgi:hypothetical protein
MGVPEAHSKRRRARTRLGPPLDLGGQREPQFAAERLAQREKIRSKTVENVPTVRRQTLLRVRMSAAELRGLDRRAEERRQTRSKVVRDLVQHAMLGSQAGVYAALDELAAAPDPLADLEDAPDSERAP